MFTLVVHLRRCVIGVKYVLAARLWDMSEDVTGQSLQTPQFKLTLRTGFLMFPRKPPENETIFHTQVTRFYSQQERIHKVLNLPPE